MCLPVKPYKIEREWKASGLRCAVVLAREASHRCGYVRVPPSHPLHGKGYDAADIEVHGGLTFAGLEPCTEHPDGQGWWFGFDCAHSGDESMDPDATPETVSEDVRRVLEIHRECAVKYPMHEVEHYWRETEVIAETERLASQLAQHEQTD